MKVIPEPVSCCFTAGWEAISLPWVLIPITAMMWTLILIWPYNASNSAASITLRLIPGASLSLSLSDFMDNIYPEVKQGLPRSPRIYHSFPYPKAPSLLHVPDENTAAWLKHTCTRCSWYPPACVSPWLPDPSGKSLAHFIPSQ